MSQKSKYTGEFVLRMAELWRRGKLAREIGLNVGLNKNQVIGIINRNRPLFPERDKAPSRRKPNLQRLPPTRHKKIPIIGIETTPPPEPLNVGAGERLTVLHLSEKTCKWPINHPGEPDFHFCGRPPSRGPYCEYHANIAYVSVEDVLRRSAFRR